MTSGDEIEPAAPAAGGSVDGLPRTDGELVLMSGPEGVLVGGDPVEVERYVARIREVAGETANVTAVDQAFIGNAFGLTSGGASLLGQSAKFVQLHAESVKALKVGKTIPGDPGYYRMMTRGADGKFLTQLQWKATSLNPQRLMAVQMIAIQVALTSAIAQVEESVQRVEDKVDAVLALAEAKRAGDVIGNRETVLRLVHYVDRHGRLPDALWESVSTLGPVLDATVEQLRNHVERVLASLTSAASVPERARLSRRAIEVSKLRETLDLLVIAEDSLHKWQRLLVARVATTERDHLSEVLGESRELLRRQLQKDGMLYQQAKVAIDAAAKIKSTDGFRVRSLQKLVRYRDALRDGLDSFAKARGRQVETWDDLEPPDLKEAVAGTVDMAIAATARTMTGAGTRLTKIGEGFLEDIERRQNAASDTALRKESGDETAEPDDGGATR